MYEFARKIKRLAGLARNPENKRCPVCKEETVTRINGDMFCSNYKLDYEKQGGCFWHRYENGLNYWSEPEELIRVLSKKYGITLP